MLRISVERRRSNKSLFTCGAGLGIVSFLLLHPTSFQSHFKSRNPWEHIVIEDTEFNYEARCDFRGCLVATMASFYRHLPTLREPYTVVCLNSATPPAERAFPSSSRTVPAQIYHYRFIEEISLPFLLQEHLNHSWSWTISIWLKKLWALFVLCSTTIGCNTFIKCVARENSSDANEPALWVFVVVVAAIVRLITALARSVEMIERCTDEENIPYVLHLHYSRLADPH